MSGAGYAARAWQRALARAEGEGKALADAMRGHPFADGEGWMPARPLLVDRAELRSSLADLRELTGLIRDEALRRCDGDPGRLAALAGVEHRRPAPGTPDLDHWADSVRADVVLGAEGWRVCEVNVDSALGGAGAMAAAVGAHIGGPAARRLRAEGLRLTAPDYYAHKAAALRAWAPGDEGEPPRVAVLGVTQPGEPHPDAVFDDEVRMLRRQGLAASREDPRDGVEVVAGRLRNRSGDAFDLAVRYYVPRVAERLGAQAARLHEIEGAARTVTFVPRTAFGFASKRILAWLWEAAAAGHGSHAVVRRRVPYTVLVADRTVFLPDGRPAHLPTHLLRRQAGYLLKPAFEMGGRGVLLGRATDERRWRLAVDEALSGACPMVAQRYVAPRPIDVPIVHGDALDVRRVTAVVSPFLLRGRYAGSFCRLAPAHRSPVVNWEDDLLHTALVSVDRGDA
ncbi:hypothetical protein GCM10010103_75960 [Streptomyces paradoxus]|uniref:Circularly permuted type 2 ATP-grasp protein n=1 Tax=Streptomyces paradoxus TaxID=66375 RepID=A0A7W9TL82_9ACTN|nr:hypothetical protein [Streptomyces paradoxus]MBB6081657.1 hypothetical protein [Streptomyces paradoxus]